MRRFVLFLVAAAFPPLLPAADPPAEITDALKAIKAVGPEGEGSEAAAKGWKAVVKAGGPALVPTLTAFDDATPRAANWLRSAVNAIVEEEENGGRTLSKIDLGKFAADKKRHPTARRIAFELLEKADAATAAAMLPDFLNDPSPDLRRDAVAAGLKDADSLANTPKHKEALEKLFAAARDRDQVEAIAKKLKDLGTVTNTTRHFGYVTEWAVSEEFDNKEEKGFAINHGAETTTDTAGWTPDKVGTAYRGGWKYAQSHDPYGSIDLNKVIAEKKEVLAYASATLVAAEETKGQVRLASQNALKVFVNGKEVYAKDEYHHGHKMDQHTVNVTLAKGRNELLVKVLQNNQPYDWTKKWEFSARVCDATGGALPLKQVVVRHAGPETVELGELAPAPKKEEEKK